MAVGNGFGIVALCLDPLLDIVGCYLLCRLAKGVLPVGILPCKDGESVFAVLRSIGETAGH